MKPIAATALSLALLALGCGQANRGGTATGSGTPASAPSGGAVKDGRKVPFVRVAELEIDPAQLEGYTAAVKEEMETSVRVEPGVLAIYCVAEKDDPAKLRFFEMNADEAAYRSHIDSPHFKKYVATTNDMIRSRRLIDAVPVQLSAKER